MSASVHELSPGFAARPVRYANHVDLRDIIIDGPKVAHPLRYSDDRWNLDGHPAASRRLRVQFDLIPELWRSTLKDWVLLLTNPHLASTWSAAPAAAAHASKKPSKWTTAASRVKVIASTLHMMADENHRHVDEADWRHVTDSMLQITSTYHNRTQTMSVETAARVGQVLRQIHDTGPIHGHESPFGTRPWGTRDVNAAVGYSPPVLGERRNKWEPHAHVGALLGVCIYMLENLAGPVVQRLEWWLKRSPLVQRDSDGRLPADTVARVMSAYAEAAGAAPLVANEPANASRQAVGERNGVALSLFSGLRDAVGQPTRIYQRGRENESIQWSLGADPCPLPLDDVPGLDGTLGAWTEHLLPGDGLELWADRLVFAAYYVIAATTGLRKRAIDALEPEPLSFREYDGESRAVMRGYLLKNTSGTPPVNEWFVNDHVVRAIRFLQRVAALYEVKPVLHPRTAKPCLITYQLISSFRNKTTPIKFTVESIGAWLLPAARDLADRGLIPPVDDIEAPNATTIRNTAMDAFARERLGDAVAAAMGHWSNMHTAYGYMGRAPSVMLGRRPNVISLADPDEARERAQTADAADLLGQALAQPDSLTGAAASRLVGTATARLGPVNGPVSDRALMRAAKKENKLRFGWLSACMGGSGGLCNDDGEIRERLCRLGCREQVLTRYHRAKLEYGRRMLSRMGPVGQRFGVKLDGLAPEVADEFAEMADAELVSILTDGWPDSVRKAVFDE